MHRFFVRYSVVLVALLLVGRPAFAEGKRELVVLLLVDAMRPDHLGVYGYGKPTSPVMDALAAEGTRYTRAYVNAPWTRPSTTCFLTGMNASRHRTETAKSKLPDDVTTIAQRLAKAGWSTAGFTANGNGGSLAGLEKGFQRFEDPTNTYTKAVRGETYNGLPHGQFMAEKVLGYLATSKAQKQFVFVFLVDPHDPYGAPPALEQQFLGKDFKGTIRRKASWEVNNNYPADELFSMQAIYDAGIKNADLAIGQIVEGLKAQGRWNDTTLFISADHGEAFGEHGVFLHAHHFYDEITRVPLIAHGSRFSPAVNDRLTQSIDVSATILDIAGVKAPDLKGVSLLAPAGVSQGISEYNEFGIHRQAIIADKTKVVWQRPADEEWYMREVHNKALFPSVSFDKDVVHVFDLAADPKEKTNLASTMPGQSTAMLAELRAFVAGEKKQ